MREQLATLARRAIDEKVFPGCVIGTLRSDGADIACFGRQTYESDSPEVWEGTIYDLASVTKSIPIALLTAMLVAQGKLRLDDRVVQYLPTIQNDHGATIEDLLRYRVHGAQLSKLGYQTFEEIRTHALERGFDGAPGESVYTNLPAFLLGIILERVAGASLPVLAHRTLFEPLNMKETTFFPSRENCAPTEVDDVRGEVRGLPHDESAYLFAKKRRAVGHAGLFSSALDLLNFLETLLNGKLGAIARGAKVGLGWQTEGVFLGSHPVGRFGKTGFTGTSILCDMERGVGLVILSNRTYPHRPSDSNAINAVRLEIADVALSA